MVINYYIKTLRTGADKRNGILMSLLLLVAETITSLDIRGKVCNDPLTQKIPRNVWIKLKLDRNLLYPF